MISRCPGCAALVDEDAERCPKCRWDFKARARVDPPQSGAQALLAQTGPRPVPSRVGSHSAGDVEDLVLAAAAPQRSSRPQRPQSFLSRTAASAAKAAVSALVILAAALALRALHERPSTGADNARPEMERPAREAAPGEAQQWVFEGVAYDIDTMHPAQGATLLWSDGSQRVIAKTTVGRDGDFNVVLPPLGSGYVLRVESAGYWPGYIDGDGALMRQASADQRRRLASEAPANRPWLGRGGEITRRDALLLPKTGL